VRDLLNLGGDGWNHELLSLLFPHYIATKIVGCFVSKSRNDVLYWHNNLGGRFSCKSAYLLALEADEYMDRITIFDDLIEFWRVVWKARDPSKVKLFMWRAWNNYVPTIDNLQSRGQKRQMGDIHDDIVGTVDKKKQTFSRPLMPEIDLIKVNCDAAWKKESGKAGLGFVARDHNDEVLFSGARLDCYASSPLEAEAKAIHWAMTHVTSLFSDILSHSLAFDVCHWSFVKWEGNRVAHSIANVALSCSYESILDGGVLSCANAWMIKDVLSSNME
ncbi:reverse transcriptase, partial [Tanacetum coccineum]